jgi:hypothetical protein
MESASPNPHASPKSSATANDAQTPASQRAGVWFKVRLGFHVFGLAGGALFAHQGVAELARLEPWELGFLAILSGVAVLLMPFMLVMVLSIQAVNPLSDAAWTRPTHASNPFRLGNPLLFFHFAGYLAGAQGLGFLLSALWNGVYAAAIGVFMLLGAVATLAGVRLSMWVFRSKLADESRASPPGES